MAATDHTRLRTARSSARAKSTDKSRKAQRGTGAASARGGRRNAPTDPGSAPAHSFYQSPSIRAKRAATGTRAARRRGVARRERAAPVSEAVKSALARVQRDVRGICERLHRTIGRADYASRAARRRIPGMDRYVADLLTDVVHRIGIEQRALHRLLIELGYTPDPCAVAHLLHAAPPPGARS